MLIEFFTNGPKLIRLLLGFFCKISRDSVGIRLIPHRPILSSPSQDPMSSEPTEADPHGAIIFPRRLYGLAGVESGKACHFFLLASRGTTTRLPCHSFGLRLRREGQLLGPPGIIGGGGPDPSCHPAIWGRGRGAETNPHPEGVPKIRGLGPGTRDGRGRWEREHKGDRGERGNLALGRREGSTGRSGALLGRSRVVHWSSVQMTNGRLDPRTVLILSGVCA